VKLGLANHSLQDDTGVFHRNHLARLFIDYSVHSPQHSVDSTAIAEHFRIEPQPPIFLTIVERRHDLFPAPHLYQLAGLQIQRLKGGIGTSASNKWIVAPLSPSLNLIEESYD
jgi:hypothetical protein